MTSTNMKIGVIFHHNLPEDAVQGINMRLHNIEAELDQFKRRTDTNINEVHRRVDSKIFTKSRNGPRSSHLAYNLTEGDIAHKGNHSSAALTQYS